MGMGVLGGRPFLFHFVEALPREPKRGGHFPALMAWQIYPSKMNQTEFYGVVSAINFTLLGLWWVAIKDRADLGGHDHASRRMAYFVSLQFLIPATVSLLAQIAPSVPEVWRFAFAFAGVAGAAGVAMLAQELRRSTDAKVVPQVFAVVGIPVYVLVTLVAIFPTAIADMGLTLKPIEVEGLLLTILVFLGVQEAWVVAMMPERTNPSPR